MQANSRAINSNQAHTHPRLPATVQKHLRSSYRKPIADHSVRAFEPLASRLAEGRPLIVDSFCGTGHSTRALAEQYPDHLVVGVDKSELRLSRHPGGHGDYLLLRADCEDIWQLLLQRNIRLDYHYLLYPNPWPKSKHLQRRIHGSAAFAWLLALGGQIELRSNWQLYVEEFGLAMHLAGCPGVVSQLPEQQPLTLFEQKYRDSGHRLWRFLCTADA